MNLLERVLTLLRANLNNVVEQADDPEKVLRQLHLDMRNQLVQVKTQVATAIAEGHKLQKRSQERKELADGWLAKAEQAVQQGNDDTARQALIHYNDINKQSSRYQQQKKEQEQLVTTMRNALRQLEAKIAEVDTTIDLLVTRKRNALIQQRVFEALNKHGSARDRTQTTKAQEAVLEAEARARALADLNQRSFDVQLDKLTEEQEVEQQLQDMKTKQKQTREQPLLSAGQAQTSPLLRPQPQPAAPVKRKEKSSQPKPKETSAEHELERLQHLLDITPGIEALDQQ